MYLNLKNSCRSTNDRNEGNMDKETIYDSENINSDEWKFLLLMMLMEDIKQNNSQWKIKGVQSFD